MKRNWVRRQNWFIEESLFRGKHENIPRFYLELMDIKDISRYFLQRHANNRLFGMKAALDSAGYAACRQ